MNRRGRSPGRSTACQWQSAGRLSAVLLSVAVLGSVTRAHAVLVGGKGAAADTLVAARDGETTVLTVLTTKGASAVVVPVPKDAKPTVFAAREDAVTRALGISDARTVELWEQDPCELYSDLGPGLDPTKPVKPSPKDAPKKPAPKPAGPGELGELATLPTERSALLSKLDELSVTRTPEIDGAIGRYLDAGYTFVKVPMLGRAAAIRFDAAAFEVPTDLLASPRARVLSLVHGSRVAPEGPSFGAPTSLLVEPRVASNVRLFEELVEAGMQGERRVPFTEYAWSAAQCDRCSTPLDAAELSALGVSGWPRAAKAGEVLIKAEAVSDEPGGPEDLRDALMKCATSQASTSAPPSSISLDVKVEAGATTATGPTTEYGACVTKAVSGVELDRSGKLVIEWLPLSRTFLRELVLTRLDLPVDHEHATSLAPQRPIEGGRENGPDGKPEARALPSETADNYQTRYVIQHAWKGAVKCVAPQRGVFGPNPPKGWKRTDGKKLARTDDVTKLVVGGLPSLDAFALPSEAKPKDGPSPSPDGPAPSPSPSASPAAAPSAPPGAAPPADPGGCGCEVPTGSSARGSVLAVVALALGALARRLRRR